MSILVHFLLCIRITIYLDVIWGFANNEACVFLRGDDQYLLLLQVVNLCWSHGLYDAIIYVYNKGMFDYTTPLEELLGILQQAVRTGIQLTDEQIRLGNKLLVYIR